KLDADGGAAPLLSVFGGKITTYRRLAEAAMKELQPFYPAATGAWTAGVALPGGDFPHDRVSGLTAGLQAEYPFLSQAWAQRLVRAYGTQAADMLGEASEASDLGTEFGATLTEREVRWLISQEWAQTAEDVVWRRSKLGLRLTEAELQRLTAWMATQARPAAKGVGADALSG
ncbi:MAG: glycerol-3-phosphate dehydrogenase C-terminal domain-containing protein, partial [Pseudomonadota bacterium]